MSTAADDVTYLDDRRADIAARRRARLEEAARQAAKRPIPKDKPEPRSRTPRPPAAPKRTVPPPPPGTLTIAEIAAHLDLPIKVVSSYSSRALGPDVGGSKFRRYYSPREAAALVLVIENGRGSGKSLIAGDVRDLLVQQLLACGDGEQPDIISVSPDDGVFGIAYRPTWMVPPR